MIEFIIIMIILDILMKIRVGEYVEATPETPAEPKKPKAYVCNNSMEWEFKTLDDAMEYHEMRLTGWKGNAIDFYRWKEEE